MDFQTVLATVDSWAAEERIRLIGEIWDRLADQGYEPELTDALKAELDRRADALDADPGSAIPWEQVEARARGRFRR